MSTRSSSGPCSAGSRAAQAELPRAVSSNCGGFGSALTGAHGRLDDQPFVIVPDQRAPLGELAQGEGHRRTPRSDQPAQQILAKPEWAERLTDRDRKALTALIWSHINPYGTFHIDMNTHLDLGPAAGQAEAA
jgi:hypothetical protein